VTERAEYVKAADPRTSSAGSQRRQAAVSAASCATEDQELIRVAAQLTRDLNSPKPAIYWIDFVTSAVVGYAALTLVIVAGSSLVRIAAGIVSIFALYRAVSFIHELTHLKPSAVPGFRLVWNIVIGVPLLLPSFMYEGIHNLHHARSRYGTDRDPEYLPLASMRPAALAIFIASSALAPIALLIRYGILSSLSVVVPSLRKAVEERFSALAIDPAFRRKVPVGSVRRDWLIWEALASIWAIALLAMITAGVMPAATFDRALVIVGGVALLNQMRTLVAHLWENKGDVVGITAQYLDSVNVPPPGLLPVLWAPVGLRYHALHHLLPGLPYHALGAAHRRLVAALPAESTYHKANYGGLFIVLVDLFRRSSRRFEAQSV
jgi:fatty acid desaturase